MDELNPDSTQLWLNVIFHGPFLFIYYPTRVEVVTPDTPEHVAVAGTWLGEKLCRPGDFHLTGIATQQDPFDPFDPTELDPKTHAKISQSSINVKQGSYYRFLLPKPSREQPLALAEIIPDKIFVGDYKVTATSFGTVHVLSYRIKKDYDFPLLEGVQWYPGPSPYAHWKCVVDGTKCVEQEGPKYNFATNLHIYAEAAFEPDHNHPIRDFKQMVAMLPGLKLGLAQRFPDRTLDPKINLQLIKDEDDLGIIREEQGGLRGLPPNHPPFMPPLVCDAPSLVIVGAQDSP